MIRQNMIKVLAAASILLAGCATPLTAPRAAIAPVRAATTVAQSSIVQVPTLDASNQAASQQLHPSAARLLDEADLSQAEMIEDDSTTLGVQSLAKDVKEFHHVGTVRQQLGDKYVLEVREGFFWNRHTVEYTLTGAPDAMYLVKKAVNQDTLVQGLVDTAKTVTVTGIRGVDSFASIFNWFTKGRVVGTVLDSKGWPIPDAKVQAIRKSDNVFFTTHADQSGSFAFRNMTAGEYRVVFSSGNLATVSIEVTAKKRKAVRLEADLQ